MIKTLTFTLLIESMVIAGYAIRQKKPLIHLLTSGILANLVTQPLLWAALIFFSKAYLATLLIAEACIWGIEALILFVYPLNRLTLRQAMIISLAMNLTSFSIGWVLPV